MCRSRSHPTRCVGCQAIAFLAAHLGKEDIATHSTLLSAFFVVTSFMYGGNRATAVRIGNHLGAGDVLRSKRVVKISATTNMVIGVAIALVFILARKDVGKVFSNDPEVWEVRVAFCV